VLSTRTARLHVVARRSHRWAPNSRTAPELHDLTRRN